MTQFAERVECVIIGAGPGGLIAALYLRRFRRNIVVINSGVSRAHWIPRIRNLIGYSEGLSGPDLLNRLHEQVKKLNTPFILGEATVCRRNREFEVAVNDMKIKTKKVILATGMADIQPPIPNFESLREQGLLAYCPICDAFEYSDKPIAVLIQNIGGLNKIKFLAKYSEKLHAIVFKKFKISAQKRKQLHSAGARVHHVSKPVYSHQETSIPGLYAIGDCAHSLSQVSVAVGQAAIAATDVHNKLP